MKYEMKITGINPLWISALLTTAFLLICKTGGDNVNWGYLGFEIIYPFYTAIIIGEWCKTRTDPMFETISIQSGSLFRWVVRRFVLLFGISSAFALAGIAGVSAIKGQNSIVELLFVFFPTTFFLSSVCLYISLLSTAPHIPTMAAGVLWLFSIMSMSLLRFKPLQYFYLFIRYAGVDGTVATLNKIILSSIGVAFWLAILLLCKKRA